MDKPVALYSAEFAADPVKVYDELRQRGPVAHVEIAPGVRAALVVGYNAALEVLHDPETFSKDPRPWEVDIPEDCPVLPMMRHRPICGRNDGAVFARLRGPLVDSLDRVELFALRAHVEQRADALISELAPAGEMDLVSQYALPLCLMGVSHLFRCPPEYEDRLVAGYRAIVDTGHSGDAKEGDVDLGKCIAELVTYKRSRPGADVISWMLEHPAELTDEELVNEVLVLIGSGIELEKNLISNTMRILLSDDRFAGDLSGGYLPVEDAIDEVLWTEPPVSNFAITYPRHDLDFHGVRLPAHQPVLISLAGANTDPSVASSFRAGNRAHLAWSAGPHACPAQRPSRVIASAAMETLLDRLPDVRLAVPVDELRWAPAPFFRTLESLPVRFLPAPGAAAARVAADHGDVDRLADAKGTERTAPVSPPPASPPRQSWLDLFVRWWDGR